MRIESINIRGFGCLVDRRYDFPADKPVLILEDNEHGKSTLAAAIVAGLSGMPARKAPGEKIKLKDVYKPWGSDDYSIKMNIEAAGKRLCIERDFNTDGFTVRDRDTNKDITAEYDRDLTCQLLKLPRSDFQRLAFISGKQDYKFDETTGIQARLSALVEGSDADSSAEKAVNLLDRAQYGAVLVKTAGKRLNDDLSENQRKIRELDAVLDEAGEDVRRLEELQLKREELAKLISELDDEFVLACLAKVRERIASAESSAAEVSTLEGELEGLSDYAAFPAERSNILTSSVSRLEERKLNVAEVRSKLAGVVQERSVLQSRIGEMGQFNLAADQDLLSIGASEDSILSTGGVVEDIEREINLSKNQSPQILWKALAGIGGIGAVVCISLMILSVITPVVSVIGAAAFGMIAAIGMAQIVRLGRTEVESAARLRQAKEQYDFACTKAIRLLSGLGVQCEPQEDILRSLSRTREALSAYLEDKKKLASVDADIASLNREVSDKERSVSDENKAIAEILSDAGIDRALPLDDAIARFTKAEKHYKRYRQIKDELLPVLQRQCASADALDDMRKEEKRLEEETLKAKAEGLDLDKKARPSSEVELERQRVQKELDIVLREIMEVERSVGTVVDNYHAQYPSLQEEASRLADELDKVERFGEAVKIALETLKEVAEDTHKRWASALNNRASQILPNLNPDYDTLLFDDSLGFTLRRVSDKRIIDKNEVDAHLSSGAKDQVYLAVRLACCREISEDEAIPVVLDDPFIASDDERFTNGLKYVVEEVSKHHQVIILSCHKSRHTGFESEEWFEAIHPLGL